MGCNTLFSDVDENKVDRANQILAKVVKLATWVRMDDIMAKNDHPITS